MGEGREEGRRAHTDSRQGHRNRRTRTYICTDGHTCTYTHADSQQTCTPPRNDSQCHINAFLKSVPQEPHLAHPSPSPAQACVGTSNPASRDRNFPQGHHWLAPSKGLCVPGFHQGKVSGLRTPLQEPASEFPPLSPLTAQSRTGRWELQDEQATQGQERITKG